MEASAGPPTIIGGEGTAESAAGGGVSAAAPTFAPPFSKWTAFSISPTPDNAWAVDARDGHELWHYFWKTKGGTHIGNRGLGMWGNWLYMETPDDYLVCLDAPTGKERWHKEIANFNQQYFSTMAPIVVGNHILVGTGNDLDEPGYPPVARSRDRRRAVDVVHRPDEERRSRRSKPGAVSTPRGTAAGNVWIPGVLRSRDPPLHLRHRQSVARLYESARAATATTSTPARSSRSMSIPARWPGITRLNPA